MQVILFVTFFWVYGIAMDTATATPPATSTSVRWSVDAVATLFDLPFNDLIYRAQTVHREHFDPNAVQRSTLLSIKTGGCPEDCAYCPQSARYHTGVERTDLLSVDETLEAARAAVNSLLTSSRNSTYACSSAHNRVVALFASSCAA
mgnify:CR=1 FL=1